MDKFLLVRMLIPLVSSPFTINNFHLDLKLHKQIPTASVSTTTLQGSHSPQIFLIHYFSVAYSSFHFTHPLAHFLGLKVSSAMERAVARLASERPVVIFSKSSCCMCHTIKTLFSDFGVNPAVHELDEMPRGREIEQALARLGCNPTVPTVFIGGERVGGTNEIMTLHLNRSLIPMLKRAGALWV